MSSNEILESLADLLQKGKKILDIGCGNGDSIEVTRNKFNEVYGCDISETALSEAIRRGMTGVSADLNNAPHLPYKSESFDAVICLEVLEHLFNPPYLLREIHRVLTLNGQLILTTPNVKYFRNLYKLIIKGQFPHTTTDTFVWGGGHLHYFTIKDLSFIIQEAGFHKVVFYMNRQQFKRSWKRRLFIRLSGQSVFRDFFCGGIIAEAIKA